MKINRFILYALVTLGVIAFLIISYILDRPDGLLHIVFCDVGQGDAIYIRFPEGKDMLVDGGPNSDVLTCLGEHMAFWDRTIEIVLLTHPQHDHYGGLIEVLTRYNIGILIVPPIDNEAESYQEFKKIVRDKNVAVKNLYAHDKLTVGQESAKNTVQVDVLWPDKEWITYRISGSSNRNEMLDKEVIGLTTYHEDLNDFSLIANISYRSFDILLTGDAENEISEKIIHARKIVSNDIEVLKIGHHGARASLNQNIIEYIKPDVSIISVGSNNRYGHPSPEVIGLLHSAGIPVKRTDIDGEVQLVTDGETWRVD